MDKSTLSNYGWIIVVTIVLAVMLSFTTPFGKYVGEGVVSVANSMAQAGSEALTEDKISELEDEWTGKFDYTHFDDEANKGNNDESGDEGNSINLYHDTIVPEGAVYVTGVELNDETWTYTKAYYPGEAFPTTVQPGDLYVYEDFMYMYNGHSAIYFVEGAIEGCPYSMNISGVGTVVGWTAYHEDSAYEVDGWTVRVNTMKGDAIATQTEFSPILASINGATVQNIDCLFQGACGHEYIQIAPQIPDTVTSMASTFENCSSLTAIPTIPSSVTNMSGAFAYCSSLTTAPVIPSNVTNMAYAFIGCTSLTGSIEVNANPTSYDCCFSEITNNITITGSRSEQTKTNLLATTYQTNE